MQRRTDDYRYNLTSPKFRYEVGWGKLRCFTEKRTKNLISRTDRLYLKFTDQKNSRVKGKSIVGSREVCLPSCISTLRLAFLLAVYFRVNIRDQQGRRKVKENRLRTRTSRSAYRHSKSNLTGKNTQQTQESDPRPTAPSPSPGR